MGKWIRTSFYCCWRQYAEKKKYIYKFASGVVLVSVGFIATLIRIKRFFCVLFMGVAERIEKNNAWINLLIHIIRRHPRSHMQIKTRDIWYKPPLAKTNWPRLLLSSHWFALTKLCVSACLPALSLSCFTSAVSTSITWMKTVRFLYHPSRLSVRVCVWTRMTKGLVTYSVNYCCWAKSHSCLHLDPAVCLMRKLCCPM